jgi:hypothetical protein
MDHKSRSKPRASSTHTTHPEPLPMENFLGLVAMQARRHKERGGDLSEFEDKILNAIHVGAAGLTVGPGLAKVSAPAKSAPAVKSRAIGAPPARAAQHFAKKAG